MIVKADVVGGLNCLSLQRLNLLIMFSLTFTQLLSVMIQACCLALLDACVPMTSVFAGVTCAYTEEEKCILDPTLDQEQVSK